MTGSISARATRKDGWVIADKPVGMTSMQLTSRVRRWLGARKAGHAGTLDPLAGGVLPIAFGQATKTIAALVDGTKEYRFTVAWGENTDTDDAAGRVIGVSGHRPDRARTAAALTGWIGDVIQRPPDYSALKIGGRRAYDLARRGISPRLVPRHVRIDALTIVGWRAGDSADFFCRCGKGVYIRALARDLAAELGTCGHIRALRRVRVGPFGEHEAIPLDRLEAICEKKNRDRVLLPLTKALNGLPVWRVSDHQALLLRSGRPLDTLHVPLFSGWESSRILAVDPYRRPVAVLAKAGAVRVCIRFAMNGRADRKKTRWGFSRSSGVRFIRKLFRACIAVCAARKV